MAARVRITPEAEANLRAIGDYIAQDDNDSARRFVASLRSRIRSLASFPARHGQAPEAVAVGVDLRQAIQGPYRILYTFNDTEILIHAVRHGAQRPITEDDVPASE